MTTVAIVYHSGYGHTKRQAEAVKEGAASVEGVRVTFLTAQEAEENIESLNEVDAIIFGAPTYMGSASGPMKSFMDATSKPWFQSKWKDKIAGGFTNSGSASGDKLSTLTQFAVLAAQHGMIWVSLGENNQAVDPGYNGAAEDAINRLGGYLGAMAQSENAPAEEGNPPKGDIDTAFGYGARVAKAAQRWNA
ncbi:MAG: flavodoxin family protein [Pseudomonadota bacterium]